MRNVVLFFLVLGMACCSEKETKNNVPPISKFTSEDDIDKIQLNGTLSSDPDHQALTYTWSSSSDKIQLKIKDSPATPYFKLPAENKDDTATITLKVSNKSNANISHQSITIPALTQVRAFGLGRLLLSEVSNNDSYEWYLDQGTTGTFASVNCGPTSVTMAIKWTSPDFHSTPLDARNTYRSGGGWWYTDDIINYLNKFNVYNWTVPLTDFQNVKDEINEGNIAILCLDMFYISPETAVVDAEYRKNKFYATEGTGWGHFIVLKGFKVVDGLTYFEVYDPYDFGKRYTDQSLKGENRYYKGDDLQEATRLWWSYAIVVSKNAPVQGGRIKDRRIVNTSEIKHMPGR